MTHELGKRQNQTSRARDYLISNGILYSPGQRELVSTIPHLADYLLEHDDSERRGLEAMRQWQTVGTERQEPASPNACQI